MRNALLATSSFLGLASAAGLNLNINDDASIRNAAATAAYGLMKYYDNNASTTPAGNVGLLNPPYYWWESGAMWGGMVDYWAYTGDQSYVVATQDALAAQLGPAEDLIIPAHRGDEGNDDQAFWALTHMSAAELHFPSLGPSQPSYLTVATNAFNNIASRWDTATCGGGFKWQIYPENSYGYNYKNSISNGAFLQLAARLARYTGNSTYIDYAERTWHWMWHIGLINHDSFAVYDGTDDRQNCSEVNHIQFSYNVAVLLHGAASIYNATTGSVQHMWARRVLGLLQNINSTFVTNEGNFPNKTGIMFEVACEPHDNCNTDMQSFKAYMGRWLGKTAALCPLLGDRIMALLRTNAEAAAESCTGGTDGVTCGTKWYVGGYDGAWGVGQQMSALEVVQSLLALEARPHKERGVVLPLVYGNRNTGGSAPSSGSSAPVARPTTNPTGLAAPGPTGPDQTAAVQSAGYYSAASRVMKRLAVAMGVAMAVGPAGR
ncbi:hypothetical protein LTS18_014345 [Coniosporium uncinatum]|uniref:Uncharacterized protein n=1 Tax=Coniosporium uncinatum TaxID=93489 RepID=A0ACC3D8M2_9PEZI|nr:hypothetical protein LTS18_014345 [Coniosporium uncinatum]